MILAAMRRPIEENIVENVHQEECKAKLNEMLVES